MAGPRHALTLRLGRVIVRVVSSMGLLVDTEYVTALFSS